MHFLKTQITPGEYILVNTTLSHHKQVVILKVMKIDEMPEYGNDQSGTGEYLNSKDHVGFYQSQIVGFPTHEEIAKAMQAK